MNIPPINAMIDIETLGTTPGSVILSIAAVEFTPNLVTGREFYERIDIESCLDLGLKVEADTLKWWLKQSDEARSEITNSKFLPDVTDVLLMLGDWISVFDDNYGVWGNSASFDCGMITYATKLAGYPNPWNFRSERCYRTVKNLFPDVPFPTIPGIVQHHALHDAKAQAEHLISIIKETQ